MCRNDKKLLKYELQIELFDDVSPFKLTKKLLEENIQSLNDYKKAYEQYKGEDSIYEDALKDFETQEELYEEQQAIIEEANTTSDQLFEQDEIIKEPVRPKSPKAPGEPPRVIEPSFYNKQSVGRLYMNLTKSESPKRWRKLQISSKSDQGTNIRMWWEQHEKYEDELDKLDPYDDEEEPAESPTKPKTKKKSKFFIFEF